MLGKLTTEHAVNRPDLLAPVVPDALRAFGLLEAVEVAAIDPSDADTAAFCARYEVKEEESANCVIVQGRRGESSTLCACVVLATSRVDVNGTVRRRLQVKKASFAPMELAVEQSAMAYGGITPIGLPESWPIFVDPQVVARSPVVLGSGIRGSKVILDGPLLSKLPNVEVVEGLGIAR